MKNSSFPNAGSGKIFFRGLKDLPDIAIIGKMD